MALMGTDSPATKALYKYLQQKYTIDFEPDEAVFDSYTPQELEALGATVIIEKETEDAV